MPELNKNWRAHRAQREAYRLEQERVRGLMLARGQGQRQVPALAQELGQVMEQEHEQEQQLARARQDAIRNPPGIAGGLQNLGQVRPTLLDGGYGNIDPNLGYGRPPPPPLPPPPPPHDNARDRAGLFDPAGRGGLKGLRRMAPAPAPAAFDNFLGAVKGARVAKRGRGEGA